MKMRNDNIAIIAIIGQTRNTVYVVSCYWGLTTIFLSLFNSQTPLRG